MYLHRIGAICAPSKNLLTESYYQFSSTSTMVSKDS